MAKEFITTYKGIEIMPAKPQEEKIDIDDIAHALSMLCRANGHIKWFYSVGQHCVNCAIEAQERGYSRIVQLACLLHDGSEAYLADIARPVKQQLPDYLAIEENLQDMIYKKFLGITLDEQELALVKEVDDYILEAEFSVLKKGYTVEPPPRPELCFEQLDFAIVEKHYIKIFLFLTDI